MKKFTFSGYSLIAAAVLSLISVIFYVITGTTGYLSGNDVNALPIAFGLIGAALAVLLVIYNDKVNALPFGKYIETLTLVVIVVLLSIGVVTFINERIGIIGDMLIPVNHPDQEITAVGLSITGVVIGVLGLIGTFISGFMSKIVKD